MSDSYGFNSAEERMEAERMERERQEQEAEEAAREEEEREKAERVVKHALHCTYKGCDRQGVGKAAETASHWLCTEHLQALTKARDEFYTTGDESAMKRMIGHAVRAMSAAPQKGSDTHG